MQVLTVDKSFDSTLANLTFVRYGIPYTRLRSFLYFGHNAIHFAANLSFFDRASTSVLLSKGLSKGHILFIVFVFSKGNVNLATIQNISWKAAVIRFGSYDTSENRAMEPTLCKADKNSSLL